MVKDTEKDEEKRIRKCKIRTEWGENNKLRRTKDWRKLRKMLVDKIFFDSDEIWLQKVTKWLDKSAGGCWPVSVTDGSAAARDHKVTQ
jgi:hypothetical protein